MERFVSDELLCRSVGKLGERLHGASRKFRRDDSLAPALLARFLLALSLRLLRVLLFVAEGLHLREALGGSTTAHARKPRHPWEAAHPGHPREATHAGEAAHPGHPWEAAHAAHLGRRF